MLKLSLLEFFFRALPEEFLFIFAAYALSKNAVNINKYLLSSILFAIITFSIRSLPIHYGIHTILSLIVMIILTVNINKIDTIKSIQVSIVSIILEFICEGINVFIIQYIFKIDVNYVFNEPTLKLLYGIPSLLIFAAVITIYYIRLLRRKELKYNLNGENIK